MRISSSRDGARSIGSVVKLGCANMHEQVKVAFPPCVLCESHDRIPTCPSAAAVRTELGEFALVGELNRCNDAVPAVDQSAPGLDFLLLALVA